MTFDFPIRDDASLLVTRRRGGSSQTLFLGADYSVPTFDRTGGLVSFTAPTVAGDTIVVDGMSREERISDYLPSQAFSAARIDADLDHIVMILQEHRRDIGAGTGAGGDALSDAPIDGKLYGRSGGKWTVVPAGGSGGLEEAPKDGKSYVRKDAAWAVAPSGGGLSSYAYSVKDFGAKGDGNADDATAIGKAFADAGTIEFTPGTYKLGADVAIPAGKCFNILPGASISGANLTANGAAIQGLPFTGDRKISVGNNAALTVEQYGTGEFKNAAFAVETFENFNVANGAFGIGHLIRARKNGGTGHREALHVEQTSVNSAVNEFVVAIMGSGSISAGSGMVFGLNGYAQVLAGADASANCVGAEVNTDLRRSAASKVGLQVVDVNTSTGSGTTYDAGILICAQNGAARFNDAIVFGANGGDTNYAVHDYGNLIVSKSTSMTLNSGLNLEGVANWATAPIVLRGNNKGVKFGSNGGGGEIFSETFSGASKLAFVDTAVHVRSASGQTTASFANTESYLTFVTSSGPLLRRVIADGANSARSGYRLLICEN